jgi:hypothetical protein
MQHFLSHGDIVSSRMHLAQFRGCGKALMVVALAASAPLYSQSRRAILVGIGDYNPSAAERQAAGPTKPPRLKRPSLIGDASARKFPNLAGARNDVELMRVTLQSLGISEAITLLDQNATADAILFALQKELVDDARPGDVRIFYFSGYASRIRNMASSPLAYEETLVPADYWRGVLDITGNELRRILGRAAKKGVRVTVLFDASFGDPNAPTPGNAAYSVNEPEDRDPTTGKPLDPEALGVLTILASQPDQPAAEISVEGRSYGAFTYAFTHAVFSPNQPAQQLLQKTISLLREKGVFQNPVIGGTGRMNAGIFGDPADTHARPSYLVDAVSDGAVRLRGPIAAGLAPGVLVKSAKGDTVVKVTQTMGMIEAQGVIVSGGAVSPGDVFTVDESVAAPSLYVYIPKPAASETLFEATEQLARLRKLAPDLEWITDPSEEPLTHLIYWNGTEWMLEPPRGVAPVALGAHLNAERLAGLLQSSPNAKPRLFAALPPTPELANGLRLPDDPKNSVKPMARPGDANYRLTGRLTGDDLEYGWVRDFATTAPGSESLLSAPREDTPLPARSDWVKLSGSQEGVRISAATLTEFSYRLARVRAWFTLRAPCCDTAFPYHLAFKNLSTGQFNSGGEFHDRDKIKIYLRSELTRDDLQKMQKDGRLAPRWVYVFAIDHLGAGVLLFPTEGRGNEGNRLPVDGFEREIAVSGASSRSDFEIAAPFGVDSYFLIASAEPVDPSAFSFSGVVTRGGATDPLTALFLSLGSPLRGLGVATVNSPWSIETVSIRSAPAAH